MDQFSAGSCIRFGWEVFKKRPGYLIGVTAVFFLLSWVIGSISRFATPGTITNGLLAIIVVGLSFLIDMGIRAFGIKAHDDVSSASIEDLWHPQHYVSYVIAIICTGILVVLGLILLIVPGIILALTFMFVKLVVIDKQLGPIEAMRESARITKGHRWELLAFFLLLVILNILGAICLLIGLLVTIPITMLSMVHAYRTLERMAGPALVA